MAVVGGTAKFTAYDSVGAPLNGGLLFAYEVGTTTKKDTYTSASEGATNANPVVLDSRGEADVWFKGQYKLVLAPSTDSDPPTAAIWTVDNYDPQTTDLTNGILDDNGNELITFATTASAVNHIKFTNATTTNGPTIEAVGDDTDIDVNITAKGTGTIVFSTTPTFSDNLNIAGVAANAALITLGEDTSNGTNTFKIKAAASIASNIEWTLPAAAPTNLDVLTTDGSGVLSYISRATVAPAASDTTAGVIEYAVQSEMESASSNTLAVTPGRVKYDPGVAKAWLNFNGSGTVAINASLNVDSVTDNATGDYTVIITTDFSAATYAVAGFALDTTDAAAVPTVGAYASSTFAVGSCQLLCEEGAGLVDSTKITAIFFGDQA